MTVLVSTTPSPIPQTLSVLSSRDSPCSGYLQRSTAHLQTGLPPSTALSKLQCCSTLHYPTTNPPNPHDPWLKQLDLNAIVLARSALQELCNLPMPEAQVTEPQAPSIQTPPVPALLRQRPNLLANQVAYHHSIRRQLCRRQTTHQQDCSDPVMFHLSVLNSKRHSPTARGIQR